MQKLRSFPVCDIIIAHECVFVLTENAELLIFSKCEKIIVKAAPKRYATKSRPHRGRRDPVA